MVGTMQTQLLLAAGFSVMGYDTDCTKVEEVNRRLSIGGFAERWTASTLEESLAEADVAMICVRVGIDAHAEADFSSLQATATALSRQRTRPALVIIVSTVSVGTTTRFATHWLDGEARWFVASSPERIAYQQPLELVRSTPRIVSGVDQESSDLAYALLSSICETVVPVSRPEVCELSKLLENAFRTHSIALVSEMTRVAHSFGLSASEVCEAAATKPFGYTPFYPGVGVGGHCLPNDLRLLEQSCHDAGFSSRLIKDVSEVIEDMPDVAARRIEALLGCSIDVARILIVGIGFKPGANATAASPAIALANRLTHRGARVAYVDDLITGEKSGVAHLERIAEKDLASRRFDLAVIVSGARTVSLETLCATCDLVLDAGGARIMGGDKAGLLRL